MSIYKRTYICGRCRQSEASRPWHNQCLRCNRFADVLPKLTKIAEDAPEAIAVRDALERGDDMIVGEDASGDVTVTFQRR